MLGKTAIGIFLGLIVFAPLVIPFSRLPSPFREWIGLFTAIIAACLGVFIAVDRGHNLLTAARQSLQTPRQPQIPAVTIDPTGQIVVDVIALFDGRLFEIYQTGWIKDQLVIPRFVEARVNECLVSDMPLLCGRGRVGREVLEALRRIPRPSVKFIDTGFDDKLSMDDKLLRLASQLNAKLLTADAQLTRLARKQGLTVLDINELADSVKAVFLPDEDQLPPDLEFFRRQK